MPKKPVDYSKCCLYKIEHITDETLVYVGHTTNFKLRKQRHKGSCNNETDRSKHNYKVYQMIRQNGGWDMFRMIEIEKYPCKDRKEADKREFEVMKELNATMNTIQEEVQYNNRCVMTFNRCAMNKHEKYTALLKKYRYRIDNKEKIEELAKLFE